MWCPNMVLIVNPFNAHNYKADIFIIPHLASEETEAPRA